MNIDEISRNLDSLFVDYYDGLYDDRQLKHMLKKILIQNPDISSMKWSELVLDAQWKYADEKDYAQKRFQLAFENQGEE